MTAWKPTRHSTPMGTSPVKSQPALVSPHDSPSSSKKQVSSAKPKRAYRKKKQSDNGIPKRQLPANFAPTKYSVICGRGKECFDSPGNVYFRTIINKNLKEYASAKGKSEKGAIVSRSMDIIRKASPEGSFVKQEKGMWFEVSGRYAREKCGAWFRDCLSDTYRSSSKAKHAKKMATRVSFNALDTDDLMNFPLDHIEFDMPDLHESLYSGIDQEETSEAADSADTVKIKDDDAIDSGATAVTMDETESDPIYSSFSESSASGSFYDIDNMSLSLIPFDIEEV